MEFLTFSVIANGFRPSLGPPHHAMCLNCLLHSVIVNENSQDFFRLVHGLRQGDSLSPYLFILIANSLSLILENRMHRGTLEGIQVTGCSNAISHLLFADDSMFFLNASLSECIALWQCLEMYYSASGQSINFQKSSIFFGQNTPVTLRDSICSFFQVPLMRVSDKYLGLPAFWMWSKRALLASLQECMVNKMDGWKSKFLCGRERGFD